jgi:hypothetical protein
LEVKVADELDAVLARIDQQEEPTIPEGITALELLRLAYRGKIKLTPQQARCAIEALPYENPKLSATAIATMDGKSFAEALDRCIERSKQSVPLLNSHTEQLPASEMKKPFQHFRRF